MKNIYIFLFSFLFISKNTFSNNTEDSWDNIRFQNLPYGTYDISTGTGFFVNQKNIITNRHVVEKCDNIAVRGAVPPSLVKLIKLDDYDDLAILESEHKPQKIPYLRNNYSKIKEKEQTFVIGYPDEHGLTGDFIMNSGIIYSIECCDGVETNIQISNIVSFGSSGSPLIDRNSNIIGVVKEKMESIVYGKDESVHVTGIAVGLDNLVTFLKKNNIFYLTNSTYDIFTNYRPDIKAKDYVVNIHCIKKSSTK